MTSFAMNSTNISKPASYYVKKFGGLAAVDESTSIGDYQAIIVGPKLMQFFAKITLPLIGFYRWKGKRLQGNGKGVNIYLDKNNKDFPKNPMNIATSASWLDRKPALILSYPAGSPFFCRFLRDELRRLDDDTIILVGWIDLPILRRSPNAMLLRKI